MSSSPRQLRICPQCGKKFGKEPKLERHLLEVHGATLSIPPPTTPPSPSFLLVETQLESALAEANRCFQLGNPSCRLCVHKKPFKNSRDLAQHLVSKHERQLMCAETVPLPCPPTSSEVSAKPDVRAQLRSGVPQKRVHVESSLPTDQPQLKRAKLSSPDTHDLRDNLTSNVAQKRVRIDDSLPATFGKKRSEVNNTHVDHSNIASSSIAHKPSVKPAVHADQTQMSLTDRAENGAASSANKSPNLEKPPSIQRSKSAPLVNHSAALSSNSSSRSGTPSSGSKPPVTPKRSKAVLAPKDSIKKASSPGATTGANPSPMESKSMPIFNPLRGIIQKHTTLMDFSSVGLGSNTRKSYYTLKNS
ncbi:Zinc finger C2H2-type domain containing protein [Gracilaria domingensis]|nr:Zinc finger C2H2-type domain containing protein [Gracilaria domingensis]